MLQVPQRLVLDELVIVRLVVGHLSHQGAFRLVRSIASTPFLACSIISR